MASGSSPLRGRRRLGAVGGRQLSKPRMDPGREPLVARDALQQTCELRPLFGRERGAQGLLVRPGYPSDVRHRLRAPRRHVERIDAPVLGMVAPLDEPPLLELVDEDDEAARHDRELRRELLLAEAGASRDRAKDPGVGARELERSEPLPEAGCGVRADLCEEEGRRAGAAGGVRAAPWRRRRPIRRRGRLIRTNSVRKKGAVLQGYLEI